MIARGGEPELERRPSEQLRIWVSRLASAVEAERPWALVVAGVLDTRESRFAAALSELRSAVAALAEQGDREGLYQALSITEWAEFWSGDCAASIATCYRALDCAASDAQRLHTLLSLLSAALDMRRWDIVASASSRADELLPRARPEEAARAQALRAHAAFYRGDMRAARRLIQGCPESDADGRSTCRLAQHARHDRHRARRLRVGGTASSRRRRATAEAFGHALDLVHDRGQHRLPRGITRAHSSALPRLQPASRAFQRAGPECAVLRPDP